MRTVRLAGMWIGTLFALAAGLMWGLVFVAPLLLPDYPKLAQLWWKNVAVAVTGEKTPQAAMDNLAEEMDQVMGRLERAGMAHCAPKLNPKGETIQYEKLLGAWKEGRVR